jgi:hypothetical protein
MLMLRDEWPALPEVASGFIVISGPHCFIARTAKTLDSPSANHGRLKAGLRTVRLIMRQDARKNPLQFL